MKGQLITHSIVVGFGIVLIIAVFLIMGFVETNYREFIGQREIEDVCLFIKTSAEKIQPKTDYRSETPVVLGEITMNLPEKIAGMAYRASFRDENMSISTIGDKKIEFSCVIGINATYGGSTNGGSTLLKMTRTKEGDFIEMKKI
jgi:hypothetical protein